VLRRAVAAALATVACLAVVLVRAEPALADFVYCPPDGGDCVVVVGTPAGPGSGGGGGGGGGSDDPTSCYYKLAEPPPPAGDPAWDGHQPGDGAVYLKICKTAGLGGSVGFDITTVWSANPPGATVSPAVLAAEAIRQLPIRGPIITTAPDTNGAGLVGLPVWIWTPATEATWGPVSRTAAVPGLSVTATARAVKTVYAMGNGATVTCTAPGTPYRPEYGNRMSPDCGYAGYPRPSSTVGGRYTITGTTTWQVNWAGGGQTGQVTTTRSSAATIDIDELQVITQ
jgi:hypothetical protein